MTLAEPPVPTYAKPTGHAPARRVTPEEYLAHYDDSPFELVDGQLLEKIVSADSSEAEADVITAFRVFTKANPVAKVYSASLSYRCFPDDPEKFRRPDVSVIRLERLRELSDPSPNVMEIAPDLAVEVASANDGLYEIEEKIDDYLQAGFPLVWLVNLHRRTVIAYRPGKPPVLHNADDEIAAEDALPGFRCRVADLLPTPLGAVTTS